TILDKAYSLCGLQFGSLQLFDGKNFKAVTLRFPSDVSGDFIERLRQGFDGTENPVTRPLLEGARLSHVADVAEIDHPMAQMAAKLADMHTLLFVPPRRDDVLLGAIVSARREIRPFSEKQIALLENFAAQAVIAMDNARLLDEIRQRQAALRVTFDNMGDGVAMFDAEMRVAAWNGTLQQIPGL